MLEVVLADALAASEAGAEAALSAKDRVDLSLPGVIRPSARITSFARSFRKLRTFLFHWIFRRRRPGD